MNIICPIESILQKKKYYFMSVLKWRGEGSVHHAASSDAKCPRIFLFVCNYFYSAILYPNIIKLIKEVCSTRVSVVPRLSSLSQYVCMHALYPNHIIKTELGAGSQHGDYFSNPLI